jgi:hypothetical protein
MGTQREMSTTPTGNDDVLDDERLLDESDEVDLDTPLDAPIETPIEDALEQRRVEPLDDDLHDSP